MNIKIREFRSEDLEEVLKISQASFLQPWPKKEFEKFTKETFIAEKDKGITGFVMAKTAKRAAQIKIIAVDQNYQKQGIGKKLIEYIWRYFKNNGVRTVSLHVRQSNQAGLAFLQNFSFSVVKTVKNYYTDKENAYLLEKNLDG